MKKVIFFEKMLKKVTLGLDICNLMCYNNYALKCVVLRVACPLLIAI